MKTILIILISLVVTSIIGFLCSFLLVANFMKDEIWGIIEEKEESDDRRN